MIQILKSPIEGTVFLSESPLEIEVRSNAGNDFYFKFILKVNQELFDIQGWSKYTSTKCKVDLQRMFSNVFTNQFRKITETKLTRLDSLYKRIDIIVEEYNREDDTLNETIEIPHFFVLFTQKNQHFNPTDSLQKLSQLPNPIRLSRDAVFSLPLWINSVGVSVRILTEGTLLWSENYTDLEQGLFMFTCNLYDYTIINNSLRIEINDGTKVFTQYIKVQELYLYDISKVYFKNIFGVFEYAEFFGSNKATNSYKRKNYLLQDNTEFIANTKVKQQYKINTGFLLPQETEITDAVNSSEEIYCFVDKQLYPMIPTSKKALGVNTAKYYDDDNIMLQINGLPILDNEIIKYQTEDEIFFEADFMVLTYNFIDGEDLDTRTRIVYPDIGQNTQADYLGWAVKDQFPADNPLIVFGGDNQGIGKESCMINLLDIKNKYSTSKVVIDARALWYNIIGSENVNLKVDLYKGGVMKKQEYTWVNPSAESHFHFETSGVKIPGPKENDKTSNGHRLSVVTYDLERSAVSFDNYDTTTPEV